MVEKPWAALPPPVSNFAESFLSEGGRDLFDHGYFLTEESTPSKI